MKKSVFVFICAACVVFAFLVPCAAAGSVSASVLKPYLSIRLVDDPDEPYEEFYVQYSLNNGAFFNLDQFPVSDLDDSGNFLYLIPDEVFNLVQNGANVRYRVAACTALGCYYSSPVQLQSTISDDLYIFAVYDNNTLLWQSDIYIYEAVGSRYTVSVSHNGSTSSYFTSNRYFDLSFLNNSLGVPDGDYDVTVSCIVRGRTITSNTVHISGVPEYTISVDTNLWYPVDSDLTGSVDLIYSGVTQTPVYRYVFSGLVYVLPLCGLVFLIHKVH